MITAQQREAPGPGIYENVPASEYHTWPYCSASRLGDMMRSPAHCRYRMDNPETTEAMIFGEAMHTYLLEPESFSDRFVVAGKCFATTKSGEPCENGGIKFDGDFWWCGVHGKGKRHAHPRSVLAESEWNVCTAIDYEMLRHPAARMLLVETPGRVELSFVWDDPTSGTRCKGRADKIVEIAGRRIVVDLKTTTDASLNGFGKSLNNFGYYRQAAHYLNGLAILGEPCEAFIFIAVEKEPPFGVQAFEIDQEALEVGRREIGPLIKQFGECQRSGNWPAYSQQIELINLPAWKLKELQYSYQEQI